MKKIKITEDCLLDGTHLSAGTVLEKVSESIAAELVSSGRAVVIKENPEPIIAGPKIADPVKPAPEGKTQKADKKPDASKAAPPADA